MPKVINYSAHHNAQRCYDERCYGERCYGERCYVECRYAKCHRVESRGAHQYIQKKLEEILTQKAP
jgi:hypothetical protein